MLQRKIIIPILLVLLLISLGGGVYLLFQADKAKKEANQVQESQSKLQEEVRALNQIYVAEVERVFNEAEENYDKIMAAIPPKKVLLTAERLAVNDVLQTALQKLSVLVPPSDDTKKLQEWIVNYCGKVDEFWAELITTGATRGEMDGLQKAREIERNRKEIEDLIRSLKNKYRS